MDNNHYEVKFILQEHEQCKYYTLKREDGKSLILNHTELQIQEIAWKAVNEYFKGLIKQGKMVNKNINLPSYSVEFEMSEDYSIMYLYLEEFCIEHLTEEQFMIFSYVFGHDNTEAKQNLN